MYETIRAFMYGVLILATAMSPPIVSPVVKLAK
jgi:hypothetical protein